MESHSKRLAKPARQKQIHPPVDPDTVLSAADRAALKALHKAEREGTLVPLEEIKRRHR